MRERGGQLMRTLLARLVLVGGVVVYLGVRQVVLRRQLATAEAPYIWKAEELAGLARKETPGVKVVLTGEKGVWDSGGGPRVEVVCKEVIGSCGEEPFVGAGGGVEHLAVDATGHIYVVCSREGEVRKLDPEGKLELILGRKGAGPGELGMPMGVVFDGDGNVHVIEAGNRRISIFTPGGQFVRSVRLEPVGWPLSFAVDSAGFYYVCWYDPKEDKVIHKYSPEGRRVLSFGEPARFQEPLSYAAAALKRNVSSGPIKVVGHYVYYSQGNPYEIRQYTTDGELRLRILRKNRFMEPARVRSLPGGLTELRAYTCSSRLGILRDHIVNIVRVLRWSEQPERYALIDVFDFEGRLLGTATPEGLLGINHLAEDGRVWGAMKEKGGECVHFRGSLKMGERR